MGQVRWIFLPCHQGFENRLTDLNTDMNNTQFYALQTTFRASIALPAILPWAVLALLVLYAAVIFLMVFTVAQPSLSQTLRLNED